MREASACAGRVYASAPDCRLPRVTHNAPMAETAITAQLRAAPPGLHGADEYWGLAWAALEWLEANVREGWSTLETGSGASTIVLAAAGASHEAVTPDAAEEARIRSRCAALGIDASGVTFRI